MKKFRLLAFLVAVLMVAASAIAETASDPIVVKVGNVSIPLSQAQKEFDALYAEYSEYVKSYGATLTDSDIASIRDEVVANLVFYAVLDNKVEEYGLSDVTDAEKEQLRADAKVQFEEGVASYVEYTGMTAEEVLAELEAQGITEASWYESSLENLPYTRLFDLTVKDAVVSDEAIEQEYASYVDRDKTSYENDAASYEMYTTYYGTESYFIPAGFRLVKHILLDLPAETSANLVTYDTDLRAIQDALDTLNAELAALENTPDETPETEPRSAEEIQADIDKKQAEKDELSKKRDELRETILPAMKESIDAIYARLKAGEKFDDLIAELGTDPGMASNPEGYKVHKDSILWDTLFRDAAMALANIGDVSDPVLTDFGVHIIQYAGDVPGGAVPMTDAMRESLRETLLSTAQNDAVAAAYEVWSAEYQAETHPELIVLPAAEPQADAETETTEDTSAAQPAG